MPSSPQEAFFAEIKKETSGIYSKQGFLTDFNVKKVWSETRYDRILSLNTLGFPIDYPKVSKVSFLTMRSKILLILVDIGWSEWDDCYHSLLGDKRKDEALPLVENDLNFLEEPYDELFQKYQWRYIPPKLKEHWKIKRYVRRTKLPFIKTSKEVIGRGMSGDVTREFIPAGYWEDHNGHFNTETKVVARKLFKYTKYHNEIQNLQRFRESRSENRGIMKSLAYVLVKKEAVEEISIIMDEADKDLQKYLPYEKATFPDNQNPTMRDLLTEAAELAGALEWLHKDIQNTGEILACCHMDLKPSNILIFLENGFPVGRWKIADFGISAIRTPKQEHGKSNDNQAPQDTIETIVTKAKRQPGPYTAPEISDCPDKVGRSSDIWSYGCILVDVIASKLTGEASLRSLTKKRGAIDEASHSNDYYYRDGALNPNVRKWIDALDKARSEKDHLESTALSDCKKLLDDILVVKSRRPVAHDIRKRLINAYKTIPVSKGAPDSIMTELDCEDETPQPINLSAVENSFQATEVARLSSIDHRVVADTMLLSRMKEWALAPEPSALWINESPTTPTSDIRAVSPICSGLFHAAQSEEIFVIVYLCKRETGGHAATTTKLNMLVDLTHSLIYQIQKYLNKSSPPTQPVNQTRFDALGGTATLENAISVLSNLWSSISSRWFCVIDGFHVLEDSTDPVLVARIEALLGVLCPPFKGGAAGDQNSCKTLITTSGPSRFLRKLPFKNILGSEVSSGYSLPVINDLMPAMKKFRSLSTY